MSSHQEHFGRKFYHEKRSGYWMSTTLPKTRAHQWVWFNHHGNPPKGYHLHHIDENKSNNEIQNLELIKGSRHLGYHMVKHMLDPEKKKKFQLNCDKIRPLTKAWHASPEGRAWHKYHAIKCNFGNPEPTKYTCLECSKEYFSKLIAKDRTKFCSNACKSKWRRKAGLDNIEKNCTICNKVFMSNKYAKTKTCSLSCAAKLRWKEA